MKTKNIGLGLVIPNKLRMAGITFYKRQGQVVGRVSKSSGKRSNTLPQFIQRQKMRHTTALWKMLKFCDVMFTGPRNAYLEFASLANRLPAVFVPNNGKMNQASFLMPGIPVSNGTLQTENARLGKVDGVAALITGLNAVEWPRNERLLLYTATQCIEDGLPRVRFSMREISRLDMTVENGYYILKGEEFADDMKGWALVDVINNRCSSQTIVTNCTLYQQYTTEEALEKAADSYGGLTEAPYLSAE